MNTGQLATILVSVLVCGVIIAGMLPVFGDVTAKEDTLTNDGYVRMAYITSDDETTYNIQWVRSNPNVIKVNDDTVKMHPVAGTYTFTVIADTNFIVRASVNNGNVVNMQYYGPTGGVLSAGDSCTAVLSSGTLTYTTHNETTRTGSYSSAYIPSSNGAYVMKYADKSAYIQPDSLLYGYGITRTSNPVDSGSPGYGLIVSGNMDDGITVSKWRGSDNIVFSDITINATESKNYVDTYEFSSITFNGTVTTTVEEETVTGDNEITYSYILVPYEITAERTVQMDGSTATVIDLIPLIAVIGLVLGVIAYILYKRL